MMKQSQILTVTAFSIVAGGAPALAEGTWTLGALAHGESGYYVGQRNEVALLPYIQFENDHLEFSLLDGLAYHVIQGEGRNASTTRLSVVLAPRWEPDFGGDPIFDGLNRDMAIELGFRGRYETGQFFAEAEALADISDTHKGYEATALIGVQYAAGAFDIEAGIGARYRSDNLNHYLFGVSASEATPTRAAFDPRDSTTGIASISATYAFTENLALIGDITFENLGNMKNSPLVDKGSNTSLALGLVWQF